MCGCWDKHGRAKRQPLTWKLLLQSFGERKGGAPFKMTVAKVALRDGRHGTKGNESDGFLQRTGYYYPAKALPARRTRWDAAPGWTEGS